jgi:glutamate-1-semialdehyde 2,1-aminomutase
MLDRGIYLPPSAYESWFLSNALSKEDLDYTIAATRDSLDEIPG